MWINKYINEWKFQCYYSYNYFCILLKKRNYLNVLQIFALCLHWPNIIIIFFLIQHFWIVNILRHHHHINKHTKILHQCVSFFFPKCYYSISMLYLPFLLLVYFSIFLLIFQQCILLLLLLLSFSHYGWCDTQNKIIEMKHSNKQKHTKFEIRYLTTMKLCSIIYINVICYYYLLIK